MAKGWITPEADVSFGTATVLWPSSTKAELSAILTLLLAIPVGLQSITVHTDSQSAIDSIQKYARLSLRTKSKTPNIMIVDQIWRIIKAKQIELLMAKVKGHSGDLYNDMADSIAKDAAAIGMVDQSHIFHMNTNLHSSFTFLLTGAGERWDGAWRKNFLTLATLQHNADWASNNVENSRSIFSWFNSQLENVIPHSVLNTIRTDLDVQRTLIDTPNTFIRWDYTWNFLKTSVTVIDMALLQVMKHHLLSKLLITICQLEII